MAQRERGMTHSVVEEKTETKEEHGKEEVKDVPATSHEDHDEESDEEGTVSREGKKADFEGFLQKRGDKSMIKMWKKRYFRLYDDEGSLSYFKSEKDFKEIGNIPL
jgi:hypothetical protein